MTTKEELLVDYTKDIREQVYQMSLGSFERRALRDALIARELEFVERKLWEKHCVINNYTTK